MTGKKFARSFCCATANLEITFPHFFFPPFGVYGAKVHMNGESMKGIASIGIAETFHEYKAPKIEVHIFDFDADIYGQEMDVILVEYVREMMKFPSKEDLKKKILEDIEYVRNFFAS